MQPHLFLQAVCIEQRHYKAKTIETSATGMILCASFILHSRDYVAKSLDNTKVGKPF